jgi:hypothetical protein
MSLKNYNINFAFFLKSHKSGGNNHRRQLGGFILSVGGLSYDDSRSDV